MVTTVLPSASVGLAYSASLYASGGVQPYSWSLISGTPPIGLTLSASGVLAGTPTAAGQYDFTIQVADSTSPSAQTATVAFSMNVAAPPRPPSPPAPTGIPIESSHNWSGYIAGGGPFTGVRGTFTVPNLYTAPAPTVTAEWVGVDGSSPTDPSLIQAGVTEMYDPTTNLVHTHAWWEILPNVETAIPLFVSTGSTVTVTIGQITAGSWGIIVTNNTTGQTYTTVQAYTGPGTSAEWIVEAPTSTLYGQETLGQYGPNVAFTNLGIGGTATSLAEVMMIQGGVQVSTPSTLTTSGFSVAYGSTAPQ